MANIVSSVYTAAMQADGRQQVHEVHTDLVGVLHTVDYLAAAAADLSANMAVHATNLGNDLATAEVTNNFMLTETLGKNAAPVTLYSTAAQNVAALVAAWPTLTQTQAIFIGDYLNTLSLPVLESVFGWTPTQASQVSIGYLQPYATLAAAIRVAQGGLF